MSESDSLFRPMPMIMDKDLKVTHARTLNESIFAAQLIRVQAAAPQGAYSDFVHYSILWNLPFEDIIVYETFVVNVRLIKPKAQISCTT